LLELVYDKFGLAAPVKTKCLTKMNESDNSWSVFSIEVNFCIIFACGKRPIGSTG